jgi:hypothetical protein
MFRYAREDTHYLLYIYDRLRNELVASGNEDANLLRETLRRSEEVALKRYAKEVFQLDGYMAAYSKGGRELSRVQLAVLRALYAWRDGVAREEDESARYVLPNHLMLKLAETMPLSAASVVAACNPVPPLVRVHATDLATLIRTAQTQPMPAVPAPLAPSPTPTSTPLAARAAPPAATVVTTPSLAGAAAAAAAAAAAVGDGVGAVVVGSVPATVRGPLAAASEGPITIQLPTAMRAAPIVVAKRSRALAASDSDDDDHDNHHHHQEAGNEDKDRTRAPPAAASDAVRTLPLLDGADVPGV